MKKKKILSIIGIILGLILVIGIVGTCYYTGIAVFSNSMQLVDNDRTSFEKAKAYFKKISFDLEDFNSKYKIETVQIESTLDGHTIPADYITVDGNKDKDTIIMVHGLGGSRWTNYPIASMFLENGYNVISYDQRSSGENTAPYTTFGYLESYDLGDCVSCLIDNISPDKKIGIWGTSFGGATAGIYLSSEQANQYVDFAILDCPISNMSYMLSTEMEGMNTGIPIDFLMSMGNITTKIKLGFSYEDANVCKHVEKTKVPLLVINTKIDEVTPYFMGVDIFNSVTHDNKKIFTVEDSAHADIYFDYPDEYERNILEFIEEIATDR
jgi:dipeptidyl aminopeptidase/acylaminoacyl peptidase